MLARYEQARAWAAANPRELRAMLAAATKLPDAVIARQMERTDLSSGWIGPAQAGTVIEAGHALQKAGVLGPELDIAALTRELIDPSFADKLAS